MSEEERDEDHVPRRDGGEDDDQGTKSGREGLGGRVLSASPLIWVLLAASLGWAIWATLSGGGGDQPSARLVVLPAGNETRTVVALPCRALRGQSGSKSAISDPGAVVAQIPPGPGRRLVAVTGCPTSRGGAASLTGSQRGTTSLVLLPAGVEPPAPDADAEDVRRMLTGLDVASVTRLERTANVETIIIPACSTRQSDKGLPSGFTQESGGGVVLVGCPGG